MQIPGKEEFRETIRYFANHIDTTGVNLKLETEVTFDMLEGYDEVVMASGVAPREVKTLRASIMPRKWWTTRH
jgi:2,4-dienoyl-CoA reductase (NADPH2)